MGKDSESTGLSCELGVAGRAATHSKTLLHSCFHSWFATVKAWEGGALWERTGTRSFNSGPFPSQKCLKLRFGDVFFWIEERVLGNRPSCRSQQATVMWEVIGLVWGHSEWGPLVELPCEYQGGITWGSTSSLLKPSQDSRHQTLRIPRSPREKVRALL